MITVGIYLIIHTPSGRRYVGSSVDIDTRWSGHKSDLRSLTHGNIRLQRVWDVSQEADFEWLILEQCSEDQLLVREQWYLDHTVRWGLDYNICRIAGSTRGVKRSPEVCARLSEAHKGKGVGADNPFFGRTHTEETKRQISETKKNPTPETRLKLAESARNASPELRAKRGRAIKGKCAGEKHYLYGKHQSEENCRKQSIRASSEENIARLRKVSAARVGTKQSPETVAKRKATIAANKAKQLVTIGDTNA